MVKEGEEFRKTGFYFSFLILKEKGSVHVCATLRRMNILKWRSLSTRLPFFPPKTTCADRHSLVNYFWWNLKSGDVSSMVIYI